MAKDTTSGKCHFCQQVLAKNGITRHLATCPERTKWNQQEAADNTKAKSAKPGTLLHLLVEGRYNPQYWMHIELSAGSTLATLDNFLREVWVECCGHLSRFEIAGTSYASYVDSEFGDRSMNVQLGKLL